MFHETIFGKEPQSRTDFSIIVVFLLTAPLCRSHHRKQTHERSGKYLTLDASLDASLDANMQSQGYEIT